MAETRFRRHLALCGLLILATELQIGLERQLQRRPTRVRLAAAQALDRPDQLDQIYRHSEAEGALEALAGGLARRAASALPVLNFNFTLAAAREPFAAGQLDAQVEAYYREQFPANMSVEGLQLLAVKAALRMAPMPLHTSWGYSSRRQLEMGSLSVRDDRLCDLQLDHLTRRLEAALRLAAGASQTPTTSASPVDNFEGQQIYRSLDLQLFRYLDTFGRVPQDLLRGNIRWFGSYEGCLDTRLGPPSASKPTTGAENRNSIKFRYCMAAVRAASWPGGGGGGDDGDEPAPISDQNRWTDYGVHSADANLNNYFIRLGLCLPEACDSAALERAGSRRAIERLAKFGLAKPFNSDHYKLTDLYCLPDKRSPLREVSLLGKLLLLAALGWLGLVGLATMVHLNVEKFYIKTVESIRREQARRELGRTGSEEEEEEEEYGDEGGDADGARCGRGNEFGESDVLHLKRNWIKLNVLIRDKSLEWLPQIDPIDCLSLYSNWLKYTKRAKMAVVRAHASETLAERQRRRNEQLVAVERERRQRSQRASSSYRLNMMTGRPSFSGGLPLGPEQLRERVQEDLVDEERFEAMLQLLASQTSSVKAAERLREELGGGSGQPGARQRVDTSSLNALKVVALLWIVAGHCVFFLGSTVANGALLMNYVRDLGAFALANGAMYITELFFVITGTLTAHLTFKHNTRVASAGDAVELRPVAEQTAYKPPATSGDGRALNGRHQEHGAKGQEGEQQQQQQQVVCLLEPRLFRGSFWATIVAGRYLRIVPTYLLCYAFVKLVSLKVGGEGQLWDYGVSANSLRRGCAQESWLPVLTLTTNLAGVYQHCIVGGWYLSVDFQFMLAAVPLLLAMAASQRSWGDQEQQVVVVSRRRLLAGYSPTVAFGLLSAFAAILYGLSQAQVDLGYILKFLPHTVAILSKCIAMYTNSIFRFRAFAFGLITGHLLYLYEFNLIRLPRLLQQHGAKFASAIFAAGFLLMFLPALYPKDKIIVSHDMMVVLMVLTAGGVDLFLSAMIFFICIGKAPRAALFLLNSPFWSLLSTLSLSAFLIHSEVIALLTSRLDPPPAVSYSLLLFVYAATLILTYSLALGLFLTFELPVGRLLEALMRKYLAQSRALQASKSSRKQAYGNEFQVVHGNLQLR